MNKTTLNSTPLLLFHLSHLKDPRTGQNIQHSFVEIIFIAVCAVICGCAHWTEIEADVTQSSKMNTVKGSGQIFFQRRS